NFHAASIVQAGFAQALSRHLRLRHTECESYGLHAVVSGCVHHQSAPTAANIQERLATTEPQLLAHVIQLALLCRIQIFFRSGEVSARVDHVPIQPERVELRWKIVVIADGLLVPILGMNGTPQLDAVETCPWTIFRGQFLQPGSKIKTFPWP